MSFQTDRSGQRVQTLIRLLYLSKATFTLLILYIGQPLPKDVGSVTQQALGKDTVTLIDSVSLFLSCQY